MTEEQQESAVEILRCAADEAALDQYLDFDQALVRATEQLDLSIFGKAYEIAYWSLEFACRARGLGHAEAKTAASDVTIAVLLEAALHIEDRAMKRRAR